MMYIFVNKIKFSIVPTSFSKLTILAFGMISGLAFAPTFFVFGLLLLAILCYKVQISKTIKQSALLGFIFGFGHFLSSMYWIAIGVTVYIDEFWWAIPFALFGIPLILACFISATCSLSWLFRKSKYYHFAFCISWIFFEWIRSWIFTGLPWNLLGYSLCFSDTLIQTASVIGIYGLSLITIYISTSFYYLMGKDFYHFKLSLVISLITLSSMITYGLRRLENNPTTFSNINVRLVQPSIPQSAKWDTNEFWKNLNKHIELSSQQPIQQADIIIWSEAALVVPYKYPDIKNRLKQLFKDTGAILITGGISDNGRLGDALEIYTVLQAINPSDEVLFEYHKSHLVPFGEYMPFKNILPIKKITPGFLDYTEGTGGLVYLDKLKLAIKPLICYESIFPDFVKTNNQIADVIINVTNDSWYGQSSGPHQHLYMSKVRAIENGLPILRVSNNGISAIIDPIGRVIQKLQLDEVGIIDGKIPNKLNSQPIYYKLLEFYNKLSLV